MNPAIQGHMHQTRPATPGPNDARPNNPGPGKIPLSKATAAVLNSESGQTIVRLYALAAGLQNICTNLLDMHTAGQAKPEEHQLFFKMGVAMAAKRSELGEVVSELHFAAQMFAGMNDQQVQEFLRRSVEDILRDQPLFLPDNKMALKMVERGSRVVIIGAPNKAVPQLLENLPSGTGTIFPKPDLEPGSIDSLLETVNNNAREVDLILVPDLNALASKDVKDKAAPETARNAEVFKKLNRLVGQNGQVGVLMVFADHLDDYTVERLKELKYRVIRWNEDLFGPEVFFDKADAELRRGQAIRVILEEQQAARSAVGAANASSETPQPQDQTNASNAPSPILTT